MKASSVLAASLATLWVGGLVVAAQQAPPAQAPKAPTYTRDVAPILFKNCTTCHRPGEIAPMSLLTYDDVRPHAKDIRDEISEGNMPPWHAAAPKGTFLNERGLTESEKETLLAWVRAGAPKGDAKDMPKAPTYPDGWSIGTPDVVLEMAEVYKVPADGVIEYEYFYIPDELHRAEVDSGDRAAARQSRGRASCARVLPRDAGHQAPAPARAEPRTDGDAGEGRERNASAA